MSRRERSTASETTPLGALVRGVAAGLVGTAAMTIYQEGVSAVRNRLSDGSNSDSEGSEEPEKQRDPWADAPAPAQVGRRILEGVFEREVPPERIGFLTNAVHWSYGTLWGTAYGLVQGTFAARARLAGAVFGTVVWATGYAVLPAMRIYKPIWEYPAKTLAVDLSYHLVYGLGVATAYGGLEKLRGYGGGAHEWGKAVRLHGILPTTTFVTFVTSRVCQRAD